MKSGIHTVTQLPTVIPGVTGLPVFRNINPVGRVQLAASNNVINTSSGNVVFSVRLAPGSMAADPRSTKINVIQDQTHQSKALYYHKDSSSVCFNVLLGSPINKGIFRLSLFQTEKFYSLTSFSNTALYSLMSKVPLVLYESQSFLH